MALFPNADPWWILSGLDMDCRRYVYRHSWDPAYKWLEPVPVKDVDLEPPVDIHRSRRLRRGGVDVSLLWTFDRESLSSKDSTPVRIALTNARSLANKFFVFNDFFTSKDLDMLCVTETWIGVGESSVFSEVLPLNCTYFNSPRLTGRGGGVATIFKEHLNCRRLPSYSYSGFELSIF